MGVREGRNGGVVVRCSRILVVMILFVVLGKE